MDSPRRLSPLEIGVTVLLLAAAWGFLGSYVRPQLLFLDTMISGGDTPSFLRPVHHLRDVLLPAGMPLGWDLGNFGGYAPYQFYFLPPSLLILALSVALPLNVAFKIVTATGVYLLPLASLLSLRALGYATPVPALGAVASLVFLFNEGNSMWGGNIPSTLAGEFAHSMGFAFAVLFFGRLYQGIQEQRAWRSNAIILAVAGLSHPVAFINAVMPGLYFLLDRKHFARNLRYLVIVYGGATLLMGFWLVPLIAKLGYATSINWKWIFHSVWDVLPKMLWPVFWLAGANALWVLVLLPILRRVAPSWFPSASADGAARYLMFGVLITLVCFFNATEVGLPEIRFVPFVYFLLVLLVLDLVSRVLPLSRIPVLAAIPLAAGVLAWVHANTSFIPAWISWNYEGAERKPSWELLQAVTGSVKGTIRDPRVAYENSPSHERFGSMRIFEDMALMTGRATLEGVLLQTAVTSPFIYWLQSQISKAGTGVIPGYSYPSLDPVRGTPRLELFNASDIITVTPEVQKALDGDPRWERKFTRAPYVVYHRKDFDGHYVRVPKFQPVLLDTPQWKKEFHRWFANENFLDVPLVHGDSVPAADRALFPLTAKISTDLPRQPLDNSACRIDEQVDHLAIEFTTTCPHLPHWVSVSYFPNWRVEGARGVYLASPAFMMVIPDGPRVRLVFRRIAADWLGIVFSLAGIVACVVPALRRVPASLPRNAFVGRLEGAQPYLVGVTVLAVLGITTVSVARDMLPTIYYQRGWKAFEKQDYVTSLSYFGKAKFWGGESNTAADATFFHAASLLRSNKPAEAMEGYLDVIKHFPDCMWVAESHYHVALCLRQMNRLDEARAKFEWVVKTYPGNRWAGYAADQLKTLPPPKPATP